MKIDNQRIRISLFKDKVFLIDFVAFFCIGLYCLFSSLFGSSFAKVSFQIPHLKLPFFVGEQLLLFLFILLFIKWRMIKKLNGWHRLWAVYFAWILLEVVIGFLQGGPLTFRNAALFYYASFFLMGSVFYNRKLLEYSRIKAGLFIFLGLFLLTHRPDYYWFSFFVIFAILGFQTKLKIWFLGSSFLIIIVNISTIFSVSRSHMVALLISIIFLIIIFCSWIKNIKPLHKLIFQLILIGLILVTLKHFGDSNAIKSLTSPAELMHLYQRDKNYIEIHKRRYKPQLLKVKLFNDHNNAEEAVTAVETIPPQELGTSLEASNNKSRALSIDFDNILFRWFIWEDMVDELIQSRNILGIGFGKPQRSKSIEILHWGAGEWSRDGWITPHNSYLHMIYRAGIIGLLIIVAIIFFFNRLLQTFIAYRSVSGILLLSVLLYWMVMANFLLIFELPYNAIFFWTLFGMSFVYAQSLKKPESSSGNR